MRGLCFIIDEKLTFSSIDICQFSMTTLLNSSEERSRSISFRAIILIMIYAGTIILNLLAASVDHALPTVKAQPPENSTIAEASSMDAMEKDNTVSDGRFLRSTTKLFRF